MAEIVHEGHDCKQELNRDIPASKRVTGTVARCSCGELWRIPDPFTAAIFGWVPVRSTPKSQS